MHLSRYLKTFPYPDKPGHFLLFSTRKASVVVLSDNMLENIKKGIISPKNEDALSKLEIIVSDLDKERQEVLHYIDNTNDKSKYINISVILNLACNFRCVYCYEDGLKGKYYMTRETADALIDFITDRCTRSKEFINLDFYGGEPLLSKDLIRHISKKMIAFSDSRNLKYTFTLVTNGSLLTRKTTKELVSLGLTSIKTTIDGPAETHNTSRTFKSGKGSFNTIITNLTESCDLIKVAVGGNYQKDNYDKFPRLIDNMLEAGLTPDKIHSLKFDPAINSPDDGMSPVDFSDGLMTINEPWVIESGVMLREEVLKKGYSTPKIRPAICQVEIDDAFVVNIDGKVYKCPSLIGKKGYDTGNLWDGITDYKKSYNLGLWKGGKCKECEYLPLCFGGCRYMSYVRDGNIISVDCKKEYYDASLERMIIQDLMYRQKP